MIKIDDQKIEVKHFPDGTQMLLDVDMTAIRGRSLPFYPDRIVIDWYYESDEECMTLWYLINHIRKYDNKVMVELYLRYIPNARMDRTKEMKEVFTLKYFAEFINMMNFDHVYVLDPHSNVSTALIDRVVELEVTKSINAVLYKLDMRNINNLAVYFPDAGAMKRYKDLPLLKNKTMFYGEKMRDWKTGVITGLCIYDRDGQRLEEISNDTNVLMIDDIISYGGTLAYSADKLKELGVGRIFAYASHTENSVLDEEKGTLLKRLKAGVVEKVFTTNSLINKESDYIEVL